MMLLTVSCLVATGVLLLVGLFLVGRDGPTAHSLQYAAIAGVAEVSASAMYLVWVNVGGSPSFAAASALMVLGPAIIPLAFRAQRPTTANLWCTLIAASGVVAVAATSLLLPERPAVTARVIAFAVVGTCGAVAAATSREAHRVSIRVLAGSLAVFAVYSATRGAILAVAGRDAATGGPFSDTGAVLFGAVVVVVATGATSAYWLAVRRETLLAAARSAAMLVVVPDRSPGERGRLPRFRELVDDVREAAAAVDTGAVAVFGGAGLSRTDAASTLKDSLRIDHGWTEEEIALLEQTPVMR
ncbi:MULTISPECIES: hypothetical protein [Microbacterium]|uniref:hypothetical protein n=1 Tax=Microbacterium TaxID=33882 RepID=UPI0027D7FDC8|nr:MULTISPECIES: hypothetical protein [Microbacterium]